MTTLREKITAEFEDLVEEFCGGSRAVEDVMLARLFALLPEETQAAPERKAAERKVIEAALAWRDEDTSTVVTLYDALEVLRAAQKLPVPPMSPNGFTYQAIRVGTGPWMVRRWVNGAAEWQDERLIEAPTKAEAIGRAIKEGSWA